MVIPSYTTEGGMAQAGTNAWPGMIAALEKMVVPVTPGVESQNPVEKTKSSQHRPVNVSCSHGRTLSGALAHARP